LNSLSGRRPEIHESHEELIVTDTIKAKKGLYPSLLNEEI